MKRKRRVSNKLFLDKQFLRYVKQNTLYEGKSFYFKLIIDA